MLQCHTITDRLNIAPTDTFLLPSGGSRCYYRCVLYVRYWYTAELWA